LLGSPLYAETRTLIAALDARHESAWAARFRLCMESGATGSEIVMALGWTAARYLEAGAESDLRDRAERIRLEAARLMA
jgi:hypothetical protein